ncbi:hypothetical protein AB0M80_41490 [Amycolatopsis sp. NPDC051045]|uniref:hypothetical protein n=1 Tax=Amycolatopsis sp. NPDC051045 TaxID=3156922 RepID=UPI00342378B8
MRSTMTGAAAAGLTTLLLLGGTGGASAQPATPSSPTSTHARQLDPVGPSALSCDPDEDQCSLALDFAGRRFRAGWDAQVREQDVRLDDSTQAPPGVITCNVMDKNSSCAADFDKNAVAVWGVYVELDGRLDTPDPRAVADLRCDPAASTCTARLDGHWIATWGVEVRTTR